MALFDLLVVNARIYTMENEGETYQAMGIKEGRIEKLFAKTPESPYSISKKVLDAEGRTILPGFTDSHMHFMATAALREMALSISEVHEGRLVPDDLAGVREKIESFASGRDKSVPILCFNYVIASIKEDRLPNRWELDEWVPGRTVVIISMDGHSSSYSTPALKKMGLYNENHDGILSGEDHEFNMGKVNSLVEKNLSLRTLVSGVQHTVNDAVRYGIVGIHCLEGFEDSENDKALWFISRFAPVLPLYIRLYVQYRDVSRVKPYTKLMSYPRIGGCGAWEMDGSIGSGTAAFYEPYANNRENSGKCYYTSEQVEGYIKDANECGFQVTSHAIGTRAIETLLSAYERAVPENTLRHRIDHFEFPTLDQVERAVKKLKLVITAQPGYSWMDEMFQKSYRKYLRPEQYERQITLKTITEIGGIICGSSDSPVQHLNPFIQIHGMVNFPIEKERLSVYQALRTYTYNGAYAAFEEKDRGTLSEGKYADFIIMDEDPFHVLLSHLAELRVKSTYIKGKRIGDMNYSTIGFLMKGIFGSKNKI